MASALDSRYIINGVPQELTPAQMLDAVCPDPVNAEPARDSIVDESFDPDISPIDLQQDKVEEYLSRVLDFRHTSHLSFSDCFTRGRIAGALIDCLWRKGSFKLGDLQLDAQWRWNSDHVGSPAAFYESVRATADYLDALGLPLGRYSFLDSEGGCEVEFRPGLSSDSAGDDIFDIPSRSDHPAMEEGRICPSTLLPDAASWLVYVPFDTSDYRLGGSTLAQSLGLAGGVSPQIADADYFIDCYEVVRELSEDGIILSAASVGDGGLLAAVKRLCSGSIGASVDISDIMKASGEKNPVRVLFAEVPGVVFQIRDIDFDYLDAELLLQDVAFYPLGHPDLSCPDVRVKASAKSGIQTILESLMQNAEGED